MKNSYNYYHITIKNLAVPVWDAEMYSICKDKNVPKKIILVHKWLPILLNAIDSVVLYYRAVKRLLIPILQIRVRNRKLVLLFLKQNIGCGYLNGSIKWGRSFGDQKHTL